MVDSETINDVLVNFKMVDRRQELQIEVILVHCGGEERYLLVDYAMSLCRSG